MLTHPGPFTPSSNPLHDPPACLPACLIQFLGRNLVPEIAHALSLRVRGRAAPRVARLHLRRGVVWCCGGRVERISQCLARARAPTPTQRQPTHLAVEVALGVGVPRILQIVRAVEFAHVVPVARVRLAEHDAGMVVIRGGLGLVGWVSGWVDRKASDHKTPPPVCLSTNPTPIDRPTRAKQDNPP